jgi:hypothetical protein
MGLIKEPLDVDFIVDSRPLSKDDALAISQYIEADKVKRAQLLKQKQIEKTSKKAA